MNQDQSQKAEELAERLFQIEKEIIGCRIRSKNLGDERVNLIREANPEILALVDNLVAGKWIRFRSKQVDEVKNDSGGSCKEGKKDPSNF